MTAKEAAAAASMVLGDEFEFGTRSGRALGGDREGSIYAGGANASLAASSLSNGKDGLPSHSINDSDDSTKVKIAEWSPTPNPLNTRPGGDFNEVHVCN